LPDGVTFSSATGGGVWDAATRTVTWPAFDLASGTHLERSVVATVVEEGWALGDHALTATATVASDGSLGPESDTDNNQDDASVRLRVDPPPSTTAPPTTAAPSTTAPPTTAAPSTTAPPSTTEPPASTTIPEASSTTAPPESTPPPPSSAPATSSPDGSVAAASVPQAAAVQPSRSGPVTDPEADPDPVELARTGPDRPILPTTGLGLLLAVLGAAIVLQARRRTSRP
jgi:hypothetical protein